MYEDQSIQSVMLQSHAEIDKEFKKVEDRLEGDSGFLLATIEEFEFKLDKHFIVEEQAIFSFSHLSEGENKKIISDLLSEHSQMRNIIKEAKENIEETKEIDFEDFGKILRNHIYQENEVLYPNLDRNLNDEEKEFIVNKILGK